jgi:hypothetical protein
MTDPAPSGADDRTASASTVPDRQGWGGVRVGLRVVVVGGGGGWGAVSALGEHS